VHLIASLVGCEIHVANVVHELHTLHPLVNSELNFASKVMKVLEELGHDEASARSGLWADCVDDILREIGIEAVGGLLGLFCGV